MYKLLKWEIRSKYKFILATLGILLAFNLWLLTMSRVIYNEGIPFGLSIMAAITAMSIIAIDSSRTFTKSLKRDYKYLLFSLPRNGYERIGSNLIMAAIKLLIVMIFGVLLVLMNGLYTMTVIGQKEFNKVFEILAKLKFEMFFTITVILTAYITLLVLIYFSKIITNAILKGMKFSGLINFIFFAATFSIINEISLFLVRTFDYCFDIKLITSISTSSNKFDGIREEVTRVPVNIFMLIFSIVAVILMFLAAGYVLDKDVDV